MCAGARVACVYDVGTSLSQTPSGKMQVFGYNMPVENPASSGLFDSAKLKRNLLQTNRGAREKARYGNMEKCDGWD